MEDQPKPAQKLKDYKVGGLDKRERIVRAIHWTTEDFLVFQHDEGISPHFSDNPELSRLQAQRYMKLGPHLSRINALLPPFRDPQVKNGSNLRSWQFFQTLDAFLHRETARAIANALTGDYYRAVAILRFVETRLLSRRRAQGQFQYLFACAAAFACIALASLLVESRALLPSKPWGDLARIATWGAVGGFLSVAIGIRKLDIDPDTQWWVNGSYGLIRQGKRM